MVYCQEYLYEVPISTVETLEKKVRGYLRRWLGLPNSLTYIALYGNTTMLRLPLKSLEEEFKVTRVLYMKCCCAQATVLDAQARLWHKVLVGPARSTFWDSTCWKYDQHTNFHRKMSSEQASNIYFCSDQLGKNSLQCIAMIKLLIAYCITSNHANNTLFSKC